jgi:hypothetical protein
MRSAKGLLAMGLVLAGLLAYLYFVDSERPLGDTDEKPKVFAVEADEINALSVSTVAGGTADLQKEGDDWVMTSPVQAPGDDSEISGITSNLASIAVQRVVDENPEDLSPYGLAEPPVEVTFQTASGDAPRTLQLGSKTPTGSDMYAKVAGEPRVFLVFGYLESTFNRKPFDLRDKTILKFERDKIDQLELTRGSDSMSLAKKGGEWRLTAPVDARADFGAVEGLISRLQSAQMKEIVSEEPSNLGEYGLTKPAAVATVGAGSTRAVLAFGGKTDAGDVYVRDTSRDVVVTTAADLLTEVEKPVADFRRKDVFEARTYNTGQLELTHDGAKTVFERVPGEGEDGTDAWRRAGSDDTLDATKVESLITQLTGLRAQEFKPGSARGTPTLVARVTFDDGEKSEEVAFFEDDATIVAHREREPGLAVIETSAFEQAISSLNELK